VQPGALVAARPLTGFAKLFRGAHTDIEEVRQWTPLSETADELCQVGRRLGVPESEILLGARASEQARKAAPPMLKEPPKLIIRRGKEIDS
jgi:hypothetical protein